ncbi:MAG: YfiH family protein [Cognaticolwellia sp.]|jgi:YfiH family protein
MRLHSPLLSELPGLVHAFSTRQGGVSPPPQGSLSLALRGAGTPEQVRENWVRFLSPHPTDALAICDQVHGCGVVVVDEGQGPLHTVAQGDALVTTTQGVWIAVRTADCVPILLAAPGGVAAVHAGWRGTVASIVGEAVESLCAQAGCAPSEVRAAIGPCISLDAYEVGPEVVGALEGLDLQVCVQRSQSGRTQVDLARANRLLLHRFGVQRVDVLGCCTFRDPRFFSHRRDGAATGRMASFVGLLP